MSVDLEWCMDKCEVGCNFADTRVLLELYFNFSIRTTDFTKCKLILSFIVHKRGFRMNSSLLYMSAWLVIWACEQR